MIQLRDTKCRKRGSIGLLFGTGNAQQNTGTNFAQFEGIPSREDVTIFFAHLKITIGKGIGKVAMVQAVKGKCP